MTTWNRRTGSLADPTVTRRHAEDSPWDATDPGRTRSVRYQVRVEGPGEEQLAGVRRAIGRLRETGRLVTAVEAGRDDDGITMTIALRRPGLLAAREAERVFAYLWYDAFGVREVPHRGRFID